jgi:pyrroline-5-carboxylate reductase
MGEIGIIGGTGWLGGAIARSLLESGFVAPAALWLSNRSGTRQGFEAWPEVTVTSDNAALAAASRVVVLSVAPGDFPLLEVDLAERLVVSVMAGVSLAAIAAGTGAERVVRAMPNAAAAFRLSYTPWHPSRAVSAEDGAFVQALFEACGNADRVASEDQIDYFTALTGSGAAFPAFFAQAMIAHAVGAGVEPAIAERALRQLFLAAGRVLAEAEESPAEIVQRFVDYAGTTAAGLEALAASDLEAAIGRGIAAAHRKAQDLGRGGA